LPRCGYEWCGVAPSSKIAIFSRNHSRCEIYRERQVSSSACTMKPPPPPPQSEQQRPRQTLASSKSNCLCCACVAPSVVYIKIRLW
jgi:hypothetical protein